jgi:hypothetical protein
MPISSFQPVDLTNFKPRKSSLRALAKNTQTNPLSKPSAPVPARPINRLAQTNSENPRINYPPSRSQTTPAPVKPIEKKPASLIPDFSQTDVVHNDFFKKDFGYRFQKELKEKGFTSAATRDKLSGLIKSASNRGLNRKEVRQGLDKLVQSGKITGAQAKYFRKISKIY